VPSSQALAGAGVDTGVVFNATVVGGVNVTMAVTPPAPPSPEVPSGTGGGGGMKPAVLITILACSGLVLVVGSYAYVHHQKDGIKQQNDATFFRAPHDKKHDEGVDVPSMGGSDSVVQL
jgi:hypothetical protein